MLPTVSSFMKFHMYDASANFGELSSSQFVSRKKHKANMKALYQLEW